MSSAPDSEPTLPSAWAFEESFAQPVEVPGRFALESVTLDRYGALYNLRVTGQSTFYDVGFATPNVAADAPWLYALGFRVQKSDDPNPARYPRSSFAVNDHIRVPSIERSFAVITEITGHSPALRPVRIAHSGEDYLTYEEQAGALLDERVALKSEGRNAVHDHVVHASSLLLDEDYVADAKQTLLAFAEQMSAGHSPAVRELFYNYMNLQDAVSAFAPALQEHRVFHAVGARTALSRVIAGGELIRAGNLDAAKDVVNRDEGIVPMNKTGEALFAHTAHSVQRTIATLAAA